MIRVAALKATITVNPEPILNSGMGVVPTWIVALPMVV